MQELFGFIVAALALTGSPGPATLSIAAAGAAFGARRSLVFVAGVISGVTTVMAITASGVMAVVFALPRAAPVLTIVAAAYMVYLAWRIATAPPLAEAPGDGPGPRYFGGVLMGVANPKAYAAMTALFSGFVLLADRPIEDAFLKGAVVLVTITFVNATWLLVGTMLTRLFRSPRANRIINVCFAVLLVASVLLAVML